MPKKVPNIQRITNNDILKIVNIVSSGRGGGDSCPPPPAVYGPVYSPSKNVVNNYSLLLGHK